MSKAPYSFSAQRNFMIQLYVRGRDVPDPVVPDMKACIDTPSLSSLPSGGVRWTRKTARAMASRRDFGCGAV